MVIDRTHFLVVVNGVRPFLGALLGAFGSSGGSSSKYLRNRCSSASRWRAAATACAWLAVVDDGPFVETPVDDDDVENKFDMREVVLYGLTRRNDILLE